MDLIHSDVCGPFPIRTLHGKLYFIIFLHDHTHLVNVQLLASKDQVLEAWKIVKPLWENYVEWKVKIFQFDNSGEFINSTFRHFLHDAGISHELSSSYSHQQNSKAERALRTLQGHTLAMLQAAKLLTSLWGEAVLTATYLWNHTESVSLPPGVTPFELVNGHKPNISHLHVFGS